MEVSSKLKINKSEGIRHHVHITNIRKSALKRRRDKYILKVKKVYTNQNATVKVLLDRSIIEEEKNINNRFVTLKFINNELDIFINLAEADKSFIKKWGRYRIAYSPIDSEKLTIKVKTYFKRAFAEETILPRIQKYREGKKTQSNKSTNKMQDLRKRDLHYADEFSYEESPNSDGSRSRREVFGGTFSGGSRSGGKRKKR